MNKKFGLTLAAVMLFVLASWGWIIYQISPETPEAMTLDSTDQTEEKADRSSSEEDNEQNTSEQEEKKSENSSINSEVKAAVAAVVQGTRDMFIRPDLKMVAVGDSLTQGVGDETGNGGYIGILEEMMEDSSSTSFEIKNYGKRGNRTDQLIKRMEDPEISSSLEEADIILLTIGANDIMKVMKSNFNQLTYEVFEAEMDDYKKRMELVFESIRAKNEDAPIYLVGVFNPFHMYFNDIPELNRIVNDWNKIGRETVQEDGNAEFIPVHGLFHQADASYYAEDNFHPNRRGYALIAKQVFRYLEPELAQNTIDQNRASTVRHHENEEN